jgi:quinol monooxygenase YgiN
MSHTVLAEFSCLPGKGAEFLALLLPALADTRSFNGCEQAVAYRDQDDPDRVIVWQQWASRADQEAYLAWRFESRRVIDPEPFMTTAPRFVHLVAAE